MKRLTTYLALLATLAPGLALSADWRGEYALKKVCEHYMIDCRGVEPPQIVFVDSVRDFAREFRGMYTPAHARTVFVDYDVQADAFLLMATIIHETAHYIDFEVLYRGRLEPCAHEAFAFQAMNAWIVSQGRLPDSEWHVRYECEPGIQVTL